MMEIEYKKVSEVLRNHNMENFKLQLFSTRGNIIKVFCWQPQNKIVFDSNRGFYSTDNNHKNKAQSFLKIAKENKADLVISPEYSIPVDEVINTLEQKELWPLQGKLWCLGMEGIPFDKLEKFDNIRNKDVVVIHEEIDQISPSNFFSCVAYLFLCQGKGGENDNIQKTKLVCILQFKTSPASDSDVSFESASLTVGNCIYIFDDKYNHGLVSYICADALNQDIVTQRNYVQNYEMLILHPQLNPKPSHQAFQQMRKNFLDYSERRVRIISVNWAEATQIEKGSYSDSYNRLSES